MSNKHRFCFITGLHRSGTSLLHDILRDNSACSGFRNTGVPEDEGQHLQDVVPAARAFGGPGKFGFNPDSYLDENSPLCTEESGTRLFSCWSKHWDLSRTLLLEKSPPTLVRTRYFDKLFPNPYFVIIIRHPIAVAMATRKWSSTSPIELLKHWIACHRKFEADRSHLKSYFILRYEDLVEKPKKTLAGVYEFLEIEPEAFQYSIQSNLNEKYFAEWRAYLNETPSAENEFAALKPEFAKLAASYRLNV